MAKLKVEWANSRALKAKIRPERDDLRPGWSLGGWTDGWKEGQKDRRTDFWKFTHVSPYVTHVSLFSCGRATL